MLVLINIEDLSKSRTDWTGTAGRVTFHFKIFDHEKTFTRFKFSFDLDLDLFRGDRSKKGKKRRTKNG